MDESNTENNTIKIICTFVDVLVLPEIIMVGYMKIGGSAINGLTNTDTPTSVKVSLIKVFSISTILCGIAMQTIIRARIWPATLVKVCYGGKLP